MRRSGTGVRRVATALCAVGLSGLLAVSAQPVSAQSAPTQEAGEERDPPPGDGVVQRYEFGLYSLRGQQGLASDHAEAVPRLAEVDYPLGSSSPHGDSWSYWNRDFHRWCLYTGSEYGGITTWVAPGMTADAVDDVRGRVAAVRPVYGDQC